MTPARRWRHRAAVAAGAAMLAAVALAAEPARQAAVTAGGTAGETGAGAAAPAIAPPRAPEATRAGTPAANDRQAGGGGADPLFVVFDGDPQAGQRVVMGAGGAGVGSACFACHGLQGAGDNGGAFPRLAAQPAYYLYKQLVNYADGSRPNDVMTPIAMRMSEQERRDVAAYYAAARADHREPPGGDALGLQLGASIAAIGAPASGVQACVGCHGPGGTGMPPDVPYLAGQDGSYLELQLRLWREGQRTNDPLGVMADVARRLDAEQRRSVTRYFAALPPPTPLP